MLDENGISLARSYWVQMVRPLLDLELPSVPLRALGTPASPNVRIRRSMVHRATWSWGKVRR